MEYEKLVEVYERLSGTSKRLEKTFIISEFLKKVDESDLDKIALLLQGRIYPSWDERKIGVASKLVMKAITVATGVGNVEGEWKKTGDLGEVAKNLVGRKKQATLFSQKLSVKKVFDNLRKLAETVGGGSVGVKVKLIAELIGSAKPIEAKYIVRTVLEELRVGVADGTLRDSIVWCYFGKDFGLEYKEGKVEMDREKYNEIVGVVQKGFDVSNDFSLVAKAAKKGLSKLKGVGIKIGTPIKVMLAIKAKDLDDALERVGKSAECEYKYDGFRIQIHKKDKEIKLFTRRLEEVTKQFPEVVGFVKEFVKGKDFILDSEAVGFDPKTGKYIAFQKVSQRIKRKYDIENMAKKFPVEVNVFDVIEFEGKNMTIEKFSDRRKLIEKIVHGKAKKLDIAKNLVTGDKDKIEKFYHEALASGNEGLMLKNMESPYKPGSRVGHMVKLKPTMETLDLVIVGAEWGTGKRGKWLSSFILACRDRGEFKEIGRVGTGFKEKEDEEGVSFKEMTKILRKLVISEDGKIVKVKPKIIIEVDYEEIQKSTNYSSGYALRFPRLVRLREDKSVSEISSIYIVEKLYNDQRGRN